jgi:hypothetical protein
MQAGLSSELWVAAYLRTSAFRGCPAMLVARGDADRGSIFIKIARLDGTALVFGPAPGGGPEDDAGRWFSACLGGAPELEAKVDAFLADQRHFDRDAWIIEVEDRLGRHGLDDWLVKDPSA